MHYARFDHGATLLGNKIYVVGGKNSGHDSVRTCERFDLKRKVWSDLPTADFDEFGIGVTLMPVKSRYAIAVGGGSNGPLFQYGFGDAERFARLDSLKLSKGWKILHFSGSSPSPSMFQAAFTIENHQMEDRISFMICGGVNNTEMRSLVLSTFLSDNHDSGLVTEKENLLISEDSFYQ